MESKILVYQAYGLEDVMRQTIFSIVSLLAKIEENSRLMVLVYTDNKKLFQNFFGNHPRISYEEISSDKITKWRGKIQFVHRVKIEILKEASEKFQGPIFYCDGDTYFLKSPEELFSKVNDRMSLMHIAETTLIDGRDPLSKKILKFCRNNQFDVQGEHVAIGASTMMWNAGVLGISQKNKFLLPLVLSLTDQMYSLYKKHVMEQLAFSFYLQTKSQIMAADSVIYHYWNQKEEFQLAINQYLNDSMSVDRALERYSTFSWPLPVAPKGKKKLGPQLLKLFGIKKDKK